MKFRIYSKTLIAVAVAVAAAAANVSQAQEQPIPPPSGGDVTPADILPGSPAAEVLRLVQSGVDASIVKNFIANTSGHFALTAQQIVALTDAGVPSEIINLMMAHDQAAAPLPVAMAPSSAIPSAAAPLAPPATEITVNTFNETLTPYGSWVEVEGYGRCWRPTTVIYDSAWRPYCDRGHWVYTDCGWYWDSDYAWGITFHYGRWFHHSRWGWCWWPDVAWAPSWVTWRSSDDYCGWAPLPPFSLYRPGLGFFYRDASVGIGFSFGLDADCFIFLSPSHFCERRPRSFCVEPSLGREIFHRSAIINNFNAHERVVFNGGIAVERINAGGHRPIQAVSIATLPNAGRHGWRGGEENQRHEAGSPAYHRGRDFPAANPTIRHGPVMRHESGDARAIQPGERNFQGSLPRHMDPAPMARPQPAFPSGATQNHEVMRHDLPAGMAHPVNVPDNGTLVHRNPVSGATGDRPSQRMDPSANAVPRNPASPNFRTAPPALPSAPVGSSAGNNRFASPGLGNREQPHTYGSVPQPRVNPPANVVPPMPVQPPSMPVYNSPRNSAPGGPTYNAPRTAAPSAPAQSQSRSPDRTQDKQNH